MHDRKCNIVPIQPGLTARLFKDLSQSLSSWSDSYRNRELLQPVVPPASNSLLCSRLSLSYCSAVQLICVIVLY